MPTGIYPRDERHRAISQYATERSVAARRNENAVYCEPCGRWFSQRGYKPHQAKAHGVCTYPGCSDPKLLKQYCSHHYAVYRAARHYSHSMTDILTLMQTQQCEICHAHLELPRYSSGVGSSRNTGCLDHDHVTGQLRGFICQRCNSVLGYVKDSVLQLACLAEYSWRIWIVPASQPSLLRCQFCNDPREFKALRSLSTHWTHCQAKTSRCVYCSASRTNKSWTCDWHSRLDRHSKQHGVDVAYLDKIWTEKCHSCGTKLDQAIRQWTTKRAELDHNHRTGKVRGWLCLHCNTALALANDNWSIFLAAVGYLTKHRSHA